MSDGVGPDKFDFKAEMAPEFGKLLRHAVGEDTNAEYVLRKAVQDLDRDELPVELVEPYETLRERVI